MTARRRSAIFLSQAAGSRQDRNLCGCGRGLRQSAALVCRQGNTTNPATLAMSSFGDTHQRRPQGASVQLVAHFGYYGDRARGLALHGGVEEGLVFVGVKL